MIEILETQEILETPVAEEFFQVDAASCVGKSAEASTQARPGRSVAGVRFSLLTKRDEKEPRLVDAHHFSCTPGLSIFGLLKGGGVVETAVMSDPVSPTILILLSSVIALLVLVLGMLFRFSSRLSRIERRLREEGVPVDAPASAEVPQGGAFEEFLDEYPEQRAVPKGEQFAAYRRWRREKGLNWSKS